MTSKSSQGFFNTLLGVINKYRQLCRLVFCASGICFCFWFYGFLQEKILLQSDLGATFILVIQTVVNIMVALTWLWFEGPSLSDNDKNHATKKLNHPLLFLTASTSVLAMVGSNEALRFVPYPTAVLAKSCKLIPTMIMGWAIERRKYGIQQWTSALLISVGIAVFSLSRIKEPPAMSHGVTKEEEVADEYWKGMVLLTMSLVMDGFLGVNQGFLKRKDTRGNNERPPTAVETMLWVNVYALFLFVPMAIADHQMFEGFQQLFNDLALFRSILVLNAVVGVGQVFIYLTITWYSSLVCTTITTTRKFFTILFSVIHFGHHFSSGQWLSICMVFSGLYLSIVPKKNNSGHTDDGQSSDKKANGLKEE